MLKFFRNIRRSLLREGRFKKYALYAAGEILLVVIGILIALQVNNWNEENRQKRIEADYYDRLVVELREAKEHITGQQQLIAFQRNCMTEHLKFFYGQREYEKDSLLISGNCLNADLGSFNAPVITLNELQQTGNLGLLKKKGVKEGVLKLVNVYDEIRWRERAESEKINSMKSALLLRGNLVMHHLVSLKVDASGQVDRYVDDRETREWFQRLREEDFLVYENYILSKDLSFTLRENLYRKAIGQIDSLLAVIDD